MKRRYSYKDCYQILNIEPGCTWDELRKAYKVQIQKWHPDRFTEESAEKQAADDKIKCITAANQQLVAYYRKHGRLPDPEVETTTSALPKPASRSTQYTSSVATPAQPGHAFTKKSAPSLFPILILISIISVLVWNYAPYTHAPSPESSHTPLVKTDKLVNTTAMPKQQSSGMKTADTNLIVNDTISGSETDEIISYGSTVGAVIAIQGPPTRQIGDTWYYGESEIYFLDGKVIGWRHMPGSALRISVEQTQTKNSTAR